MKEYNLVTDKKSKSDLPAKISPFSKFKNLFKLELNEKQEKIISDVKQFWNAEIDFSELKSFLNKAFKIYKNKKDILPEDNKEI